MKHLSVTILAGLLLVAAVPKLAAYELPVHARLTNEAYQKSVLSDPEFINQLGIENGKDPFGEIYYDYQIWDGDVREWAQDPWDHEDGRMPDITKTLSIEGWLMRGAIREDDYVSGLKLGCWIPENNPQDQDPYGNDPDRPLNHFFDPVNNRPLTTLVELGQRAPDWALGSIDTTFALPLGAFTQNQTRRNHFTIFDAIEYQYRAMTGHYTNGTPPLAALTRDDRDAYWASTFRALGDVVHLIQDMAQPQHTRNDAHSGACLDAISGHASVYEAYTKASALGNKSFSIDGVSVKPPALNYTGYDLPVFDQYGAYWSTGDGKGLAEFSNREFYSAGTNVDNNVYPSPAVNELFDLSEEIVMNLLDKDGLPTGNQRNLQVKLKGRTVNDHLFGPSYIVPATTENIWSRIVRNRTTYNTTFYSLNRYNYDAMAASLVPRAVGYSAGLIDHYFRGRLQIKQAQRIDDTLSISFKNVSANNTSGNGITFSNGGFEVFYESVDGSMKKLNLLNNASSSDLPSQTDLVDLDPVKHNIAYSLVYEHPPEEDIVGPAERDSNGNKTGVGNDTPFVLIFRGTVGEEYGLAAATFVRGGLLAIHDADNWSAGSPQRFNLERSLEPGQEFQAFSDGPPALKGMTKGPGTYLGNGRLLVDGNRTPLSTDPDNEPSTFFYSSDWGRTFPGFEVDPTNSTDPATNHFEQLTYVGSHVVDEERFDKLVTLRAESYDGNDKTYSYRFYRSLDSGKTWFRGTTINNVRYSMDRLIYLGGSNYVTSAVQRYDLGDGFGPRPIWVILRSTNNGQTFVAEPIDQLGTEFTDPEKSAQLVNLGNEKLGLVMTMSSVVDEETDVRRQPMRFYTSTNGGPWVNTGLIPAPESILSGKFSPENFYQDILDLIYLGTPTGTNSKPQLYFRLMNVNGFAYLMTDHYLSQDGGVTWNSIPGPNVRTEGFSAANGMPYVRELGIPAMLYTLDNGAVPDLYD